MKSLKMLSVVVTAAALMALAGAGTASATILTKEPGIQMKVGEKIHASTDGSHLFKAGIENTCAEATFEAEINNAGGAAETVKANVLAWKFGACMGVFKVLANGTLEIHTQNAAANGNGLITSNGFEFTLEALGISCAYRTNNTPIGILTGSQNLGKATATIDVQAQVPKVAGGAFCLNKLTWEGAYTVTTPDYLDVD